MYLRFLRGYLQIDDIDMLKSGNRPLNGGPGPVIKGIPRFKHHLSTAPINRYLRKKFKPIQIFCWQVVHNYAYCKCSIDFHVEKKNIGSDN